MSGWEFKINYKEKIVKYFIRRKYLTGVNVIIEIMLSIKKRLITLEKKIAV